MRTSEEKLIGQVGEKNGYHILEPAYSYWTISYALTLDGMQIFFTFFF
jgi:hypothetical protein